MAVLGCAYVCSYIVGMCVSILLFKKYTTIQIKAQRPEEMVCQADLQVWLW